MADSRNPPPLNNNHNNKSDSDDDGDLFVSAYVSQNHQKSEELPKAPAKSTMDELFGESVGDEIDLGDDEDDAKPAEQSASKSQFTEPELEPEPEPEIAPIPAKVEEKPQAPPRKERKPTPEPEEKAVLTTTSSVTSGAVEPTVTRAEVKTTNEVGGGDERKSDHFIEITVGEPQKIGDGMGAYVVFKVITKTNLPYFRKQFFTVNRRFSDFLGLRDKLAEKHSHLGRIVPPAPEKNATNMAKVKMGKDEDLGQIEFIEKRRSALERYMNRIAQHPVLCTDPDFREFVELDTDLPRSVNTSALSGAGVKRLFSRVGDTVNKMTYRMDESDPWFEEKQNQVDNLDTQLRKLHASIEALIHHRRELCTSTGQFAKSAAMLGNCEEHTSLSCALSQLADTEEKIEQLYGKQANCDFLYLSELLKDYINLIGAVKDVFHQRVKVFQTWQHAQQTLTKKRENKAKLELAGKQDKVPQAQEEVVEWDAKVKRGQEEFENISKMIKTEVERFEEARIKDFKSNIVKYMESLLETQMQLIKYWEAFLPEAKAIA